ncbi:MAG: SAM-dependent methyltransferase [Clostridia bacterium]|nr:SAM-dependent methyltransferase [Clostridia bacterium]
MVGVLKPSDRRLNAITRLVPRCACAADVGTDHGKIGVQLLLSGRCDRVIFSDISAPSLEKAKQLVITKGVADRAMFCVADGLEGLPQQADCIVIAGMGGLNIRDIIIRGRGLAGNARLVLQPNTEHAGLRRYLSENGFRICDERVAREGDRFYVIICAESGGSRLDECELLAGPILLKSKDAEVRDYFRCKLETAEKLIREVENAGALENASALIREREIWKKALSE